MPNHVNIFPPDISRNKILGTADAAEFVNFSIPHFRRLYRAGVVPAPIQLSERKLGWKVGDLIDWVATRQTRPVQT
jgi:predicted DNA-binding transcriptional regulator AlpA